MNKEAVPLLEEVKQIRQQVRKDGREILERWQQREVREDYKHSLKNLASYMAFRREDHRDIQNALIPWGVSSLGRLEPNVLGNLDSVIKTLGYITGDIQDDTEYFKYSGSTDRKSLLEKNTSHLLGERNDHRHTQIMVTMPAEAAKDYELVKTLIESGMNAARINCAHDDENTWRQMINNIKEASGETGKSCRILMDISGPKVRIKTLLTSKRNPKLKADENFLLSNQEAMVLPQKVSIAINTSVPEVLKNVDIDQLIKIDDGQVEAVVTEIQDDGLICKVKKTSKPKGVKIKTEKGINFPVLDMNLNVLTEKDMTDLDFAVENADIIAFSFVKSADDMKYIEDTLQKKLPEDKKDMPIIAKIETTEAIGEIPNIIAEAASARSFGIMVARGDLAVEIGYERLSEIQEELLWICEAAHTPIIWATQVLESLIKTGIPTRSEISDVVAGARAECIMLNKGDYIVDGVKTVDDILSKSDDHNYKKTAMLRALNISKTMFE
ncbi:pyruvate kinase [Jeotgalicoccus coquinae]|uniref:Pyruvate kinase n=1 Tax=Jeotgalicoccus coquinae TaxID=709509 RepID=A0A6V7R2H2_9STAP|nr:pyruvate kinase [Jeotgalicoccus coquinae]MBB6423576.1 pyruvate kinase [Jeotgalicoccus coquinae]GGE20953.1 pyruvate kinase [Jeotgalicoccus coquinae]CAD2071415.1 Pyruvate kinase [Jeotgalicoccus coquinae]